MIFHWTNCKLLKIFSILLAYLVECIGDICILFQILGFYLDRIKMPFFGLCFYKFWDLWISQVIRGWRTLALSSTFHGAVCTSWFSLLNWNWRLSASWKFLIGYIPSSLQLFWPLFFHFLYFLVFHTSVLLLYSITSLCLWENLLTLFFFLFTSTIHFCSNIVKNSY